MLCAAAGHGRAAWRRQVCLGPRHRQALQGRGKHAIGLKLPALSRPFPLPMPKPKTTEPSSYEAALEELEQLVVRIESGQMPLDQLLAGYQRGAALLAFCRERLEAVQNQIQVLEGGALQPWVAQE